MRYFTSDMHFGHRNIIDFCPDRRTLPGVDSNVGDAAVVAMNEALIRRWNETVTDEDYVFILGDACMGRRSETLPLLERLNGIKQLFIGNHDGPFGKVGDKYRREVEKFEDVGVAVLPVEIAFTVIGDTDVMLCHFPYVGDSHGHEDRYIDHRPYDEGKILLHGHVHDEWKVRDRMINVGVDVWDYRPVSEEQLAAEIAKILD